MNQRSGLTQAKKYRYHSITCKYQRREIWSMDFWI